MNMIHRKDRPTYYDIVDEDGAVLRTVAKSIAYRAHRDLERLTGKHLRIEPSIRNHRNHRPF